MAEDGNSIENVLNNVTDIEITADTLIELYNNIFHSVRDCFCPLITEMMKVRDDTP